MSLITLQSIETTAGALFLKAVTEVKKVGSIAESVLGAVVKAEPFLNQIVATFFPQYKPAADAAEAALNFIDAEIQKAVGAAGQPITADVLVTIPAALAADWQAARAKLLAFENTI